MLKEIEVAQLIPHPLNNHFFDDMEGEKWEEFLTSISRQGVINPLVVTSKNVIISGHQRAMACKALGIPTVRCYVCDFENEDLEIFALIDSNIRQRGVINSPSVKLGRILNELERICGVSDRTGGRPLTGPNGPGYAHSKTELRDRLGIHEKVAKRAMKLASMPEECGNLIDAGVITVRTALDVIAKLSPEEQVELFKSLDSTKRYTQREIQEAIKATFPKAERLDELERRLAEYQNNTDTTELELRDKIRELTQRERSTYETLMAERRIHKKAIADYENRLEKTEELLQDMEDSDSQIAELRSQIQQLEDERYDLLRDAKIAQNDADLLLIISAIKSVGDALLEASSVTTELTGDLAENASLQISRLEEILGRLKERLGFCATEVA